MNSEENPKILFVDDEKNILNTIKRTFIRQPFKVFVANSAREGLEVLSREEIDIVVSDVKMPEMDGIEFLTKVKELYPNVNRIILSGFVEKTSVINAILTGVAFTYLTKPWGNEELSAKLKHVINLKKIVESEDVLTKVNRIQKLPDVPELYQKFIDAVLKNASIHEISEIILKDLSLVTKILQVINSAFYSSVQISSIDKAVSLLGLNNIKSIIFSTIFLNEKSYTVKEKRELIALNSASYKINKAMQKLYFLKDNERIDEEYKSLGLLFEVGKLVLLKEFSKDYFRIKEECEKNIHTDFYETELELEKSKCTYREIGAYFLHLWNFPEINVTAAIFDVDFDVLSDAERKAMKMLHLAVKLVRCEKEKKMINFYDSDEFKRSGIEKSKIEKLVSEL